MSEKEFDELRAQVKTALSLKPTDEQYRRVNKVFGYLLLAILIGSAILMWQNINS